MRLKLLLGNREVLEVRLKEGEDREIEVAIADAEALKELIRGIRG